MFTFDPFSESSGLPKSRHHRKHKDRERRSKMAARLDGSESSIDSSYAGGSVSVECSCDGSRSSVKLSKDSGHRSVNMSDEINSSSQNVEVRRSAKSRSNKPGISPCHENNRDKNTNEDSFTQPKRVNHSSKKKAPTAIPEHLSVLDKKSSGSGSKPGSPYLSDEDTGSMLDQLRKITK